MLVYGALLPSLATIKASKICAHYLTCVTPMDHKNDLNAEASFALGTLVFVNRGPRFDRVLSNFPKKKKLVKTPTVATAAGLG